MQQNMADLARTNITGKRKPAEYTPSGLQVIGRLNGSTWQSDGMRRVIRAHWARRRWGGAAKREISTCDRPHCGSRPPRAAHCAEMFSRPLAHRSGWLNKAT